MSAFNDYSLLKFQFGYFEFLSYDLKRWNDAYTVETKPLKFTKK
jgi:hypothetical protein